MASSREINQEDLKLREMGFDAAAAPEQALATLKSLALKPDASGAAIARALGNIRVPESANMLAEMGTRATGEARREIRRSLFKLRQRGIEPRPVVVSQKLQSATAAEPSLSAMLSPFDPEGMRMVWIIKPRVRGGLTRLWAITSDSEGLVSARVDELSRRELREERVNVEERFGLKLIDADWRLADFILCDAWRRTPAERRAKVGDFFALRTELIAAPPAADFVHPIYAELLSQPAEPSVELLKEPEMIEWLFPAEQLKPYIDEIHELQSSTLVLNQLQQQDRIETVFDKALIGLLSGEHAGRACRRFEDIAYLMARTGRENPARWAAAAAAAIRDGADLKRIPFFRNFIRVVLGTSLEAERERKSEEPRLIVTPAEAMRQSQARLRR